MDHVTCQVRSAILPPHRATLPQGMLGAIYVLMCLILRNWIIVPTRCSNRTSRIHQRVHVHLTFTFRQIRV